MVKPNANFSLPQIKAFMISKKNAKLLNEAKALGKSENKPVSKWTKTKWLNFLKMKKQYDDSKDAMKTKPAPKKVDKKFTKYDKPTPKNKEDTRILVSITTNKESADSGLLKAMDNWKLVEKKGPIETFHKLFRDVKARDKYEKINIDPYLSSKDSYSSKKVPKSHKIYGLPE